MADDIVDPLTLDPFLEFSEKNHTLLQQMLEGLVRFQPDGNVEPALAQSWEQINPTSLRFHLRPGVHFHDGSLLNAEDVRFSVERFANPTAGYPGRNFFASIDHVRIIDPNTIDLVTRHPDGVLLRRLAGLITIVPADYYQRVGSSGFSQHPIGTGPYKFDHWTRGKEIVLMAFENYRTPGIPEVDELVFKFIPAENQVSALLSGNVDILAELPGTATLRVRENSKTTVIKKECFFTVGATINIAHSPLSDIRFRQALNYAIDRGELIHYDLLGNGKPLATLSMAGQVGHDSDLSPYSFDLSRAKALLKDAGIKTPVHLKTLVNSQGQRTAKILAKQLGKIGVILDLEAGAESEMFERFKQKDWDIGISGMPDPTAHSSFIQTILLYSRSPYSIFKNTDFDHILEDVMSTLPADLQEEKSRALDRYIYDNALSLFTYQRIKTYGINRRVQFTPYVTGMPYFYSLEIREKGTVQ